MRCVSYRFIKDLLWSVIAEHVKKALADVYVPAFPDDDNPVIGVFYRGAVALFGFSQRLISLLALGDVSDDPGKSFYGPVGPLYVESDRFYVHGCAIFSGKVPLCPKRALLLNRRVGLLPVQVEAGIRRVDQPDRSILYFLFFVSKEVEEGLVT